MNPNEGELTRIDSDPESNSESISSVESESCSKPNLSDSPPETSKADQEQNSSNLLEPAIAHSAAKPVSRRHFRIRAVFFALWAVVFLIILLFRKVLLLFAIAAVISYLLEPLVSRIARCRVPRWVAVIAIYLVFFSLLYLFGRIAIPRLTGEVTEISRQAKTFTQSLTASRVDEIANKLEYWFSSNGIPVKLSNSVPEDDHVFFGLTLDIKSIPQGLEKLSQQVPTHIFGAVGLLQKWIRGTLGFVFRFFFTLMVAAFILIDWKRIGAYLRSLVPLDWQSEYDEIIHLMDDKLAGVVRGQAVICLVNGILTAIGLVLFDVPFVFILSMLATVLSAIPIFGTILSSVPIVLIAMTHGFNNGIAMLGWILGIHALEAYLLNPKIMGSQAKIHPVLVIFALIAGEVTYGFVGALFAVPITAIVVALFTSAHQRAINKLEKNLGL